MNFDTSFVKIDQGIDYSMNALKGEIKYLNLWKYLWLHHLSGKMSLVSADLVILPPGHGS